MIYLLIDFIPTIDFMGIFSPNNTSNSFLPCKSYLQ